VAQEVQALPPPARAEAMKLPLSLAAKVSSRIAARALRASVGAPV
jgi:hypothetical protein